nr:Uncharacterised protein [Klebsiella pneumoniae]
MLIRDALKGQIANPVPPVEALAVMAVLEAAVRSAESGMVQTRTCPTTSATRCANPPSSPVTCAARR